MELGISLGLPDDWLDYDLQSKQAEQNELNILKLAEFYKKNGRYPQGRDPDPEARLLANWLVSRRRVKRGARRGSHYDGEMELGISLGLPDDWLNFSAEELNLSKVKLNLQKLAEFYKKNGRYPSKESPNPEAKSLARWLDSRRTARKGDRGRLYEGEKELGISLGLPEDWLDNQKSKSY
jgi:hypothetical protein